MQLFHEKIILIVAYALIFQAITTDFDYSFFSTIFQRPMPTLNSGRNEIFTKHQKGIFW